MTVGIQILSREKWSFFGKNNNMDGPHFVNNMMKETLVVYYMYIREWTSTKLVEYESLWVSLTYEKISENMLKMKVIQNFVLINIYIIHFIDKVCWTSQILEENSWKNVTCFCCEFCFRRRRQGRRRLVHQNKQKMSHFLKNFRQGFVKFSKLCQWNG